MKQVKPLADSVVAAIAAGEVIDRPVSVVKELVENALDAQATHITIDILNQGLDKIIITDNGSGIEPEDLPLIFTRYTTSKLTSVDELLHLASFGFRGEALFSIAQVANVTVSSRTANHPAGYSISAPSPDKIEPVARPIGTRVVVKDLFYTSPVRLQHLESSAIEFKKIHEFACAMAVAFPQVHFVLTHNTKTLLDLPSMGFSERVEQLIGESALNHLTTIYYADKDWQLRGLIGEAVKTRTFPAKQLLFVNGRLIKSSSIKSLVTRAFQHRLGAHPDLSFMLLLTIPPHLLDVNIHPQKRKVAFFDPDQLERLLTEGISSVINLQPVSYPILGKPKVLRDATAKPFGAALRQEMRSLYQPQAATTVITGQIQQLKDLYLLVPTNTGLYIVDQHALHERMIFEELKELYTHQNLSDHQLPLKPPLLIDVPVTKVSEFETKLEQFATFGFTIEPFGNTSFRITHAPSVFLDHDLVALLFELEEQLHTNTQDKIIDSQTEKILASMACRLAVKSGDTLTERKKREFIEQVLRSNHPGTCPHGRPVCIGFSFYELEKLFKRK